MFLSWSVKQSVCCSPQKGGPAQVDQGAVLEDVGLIFYLEVGHKDDGQISDTTFTDRSINVSSFSNAYSS